MKSIKTEALKTYALVDKNYGDVVECHSTREIARCAKRELESLGIPTKIARLSFTSFIR